MTALPVIARHINRQIELGKGIRFNAEQLATLVLIGVNDLVQREAAKDLRIKCQNRNDQNHTMSAVATGYIAELVAKTSKSSTTSLMNEESIANEALARAQRMLKRPSSN